MVLEEKFVTLKQNITLSSCIMNLHPYYRLRTWTTQKFQHNLILLHILIINWVKFLNFLRCHYKCCQDRLSNNKYYFIKWTNALKWFSRSVHSPCLEKSLAQKPVWNPHTLTLSWRRPLSYRNQSIAEQINGLVSIW